MERMSKEELKKELEKLKDFKVYAFEGDVYVKAEDYKKIAIENKKLKEKAELLDNENMCLNAEIKDREEENKKLKSDLSECECSMHFENDEVGYRKRECKKLKEELKKYKKLHKYSNGELLTYKGRELMEEDTLQELKDIGELNDEE